MKWVSDADIRSANVGMTLILTMDLSDNVNCGEGQNGRDSIALHCPHRRRKSTKRAKVRESGDEERDRESLSERLAMYVTEVLRVEPGASASRNRARLRNA